MAVSLRLALAGRIGPDCFQVRAPVRTRFSTLLEIVAPEIVVRLRGCAESPLQRLGQFAPTAKQQSLGGARRTPQHSGDLLDGHFLNVEQPNRRKLLGSQQAGRRGATAGSIPRPSTLRRQEAIRRRISRPGPGGQPAVASDGGHSSSSGGRSCTAKSKTATAARTAASSGTPARTRPASNLRHRAIRRCVAGESARAEPESERPIRQSWRGNPLALVERAPRSSDFQ